MKEAGKLAVLGSCHMFSDQYIDKEENSKIMVSQVDILNSNQQGRRVLCPMEFVKRQFLRTEVCCYFSFQDVVLQWLMTDNIQLNQIDAEDPEVRKYTWHEHYVIDIVY